MANQNTITLFEHQTLRLRQSLNDPEYSFEEKHLKALSSFYDKGKTPYFKLVHKGIQFREFVGVLQVGKLIIEVLPKADNQADNNTAKTDWRNRLIGMLKAVGEFDIQTPSSSQLALKSNSILELYFELFIKEVEYLVHSGLIKRYRKIEGNNTALKGAILFSRHIQENLVHQERFYTRHTTFDKEHIWHIILYKAIKLIRTLTTNAMLHSRIGALELQFPEMPDKAIDVNSFNNLKYSRKTETYRKAIQIAKLIILHYHPDVKKGANNVLALMFDMNLLWEKFVYVSLRKEAHKKGQDCKISYQPHKPFWTADNNSYSRKIEPDILVIKGDASFILDTKWKILKDGKPSIEDLRQMYVYHDYYKASKTALVYPGEKSIISGKYIPHDAENPTIKSCCIMQISPEKLIKDWQESIYNEFADWAVIPLT